MQQPLILITGSAHKFAELSQVLPALEMREIDLPEVQELDSRKVIEAKLLLARELNLNGALMVEDTALHLACLGGFPGPLVKWMLKAIGVDGIHRLCSRHENIEATASCHVGLWSSSCEAPAFFASTLKGRIVPPTGAGGFGWDAIFQPHGSLYTLAELKDAGASETMRRSVAEQIRQYLLSQAAGRHSEETR